MTATDSKLWRGARSLTQQSPASFLPWADAIAAAAHLPSRAAVIRSSLVVAHERFPGHEFPLLAAFAGGMTSVLQDIANAPVELRRWVRTDVYASVWLCKRAREIHHRTHVPVHFVVPAIAYGHVLACVDPVGRDVAGGATAARFYRRELDLLGTAYQKLNRLDEAPAETDTQTVDEPAVAR